jgi:hypothetical protein
MLNTASSVHCPLHQITETRYVLPSIELLQDELGERRNLGPFRIFRSRYERS